MKKINHYSIELCLLLFLLASILVYIKPGASIFYHKFPVDPYSISSGSSGFLIDIELDTNLYNENSLLLMEDGRILSKSTKEDVDAGVDGTNIVITKEIGTYTFQFNPSTGKSIGDGTHVYTILARYRIITKDAGVLGIILTIAVFFWVSADVLKNRKLTYRTPVEILHYWTSGEAGQFIVNFFNALTLHKFLSSFFVPLCLLWIYSGVFKYAVLRQFAVGINYNFSTYLWEYLSILLCLSLPLLFFIIHRQSQSASEMSVIPTKFNPFSLILTLLPLTPVAQYLIINSEMLSTIEVIKICGFFLIFTGLLVIFIPILLNRIAPLNTTMTLGLAFAYTITNMAMVTRQFSWYENGNFAIQVLLLIGLYILVRVFNKKLVYAFIVLSFIGNSMVQVLRIEPVSTPDSLPVEENQLLRLASNHSPVKNPNVYLLIYDSYVPDEVLSNYGIDNNAQETYLQELGFKIYPNIYTVGGSSINSISRVFNASDQFYGIRRMGVSGNGVVHAIFQDLGYSTLGHFTNNFFFIRANSGYDFTYPKGIANAYLMESILMGEFKNDIALYVPSHLEYVTAKREILENLPAEPLFCYMHTNIPNHSQIIGKCPDNAYEHYASQLAIANQEMTDDLVVLLKNDPQAIIIVAGDHGPYLTKNCTNVLTGDYDASEISRLDIQDRFGSFLAIRWPDGDFEQYDEITVLQDLFPAVFAYMYQDPGILKAKIDPVTVDPSLSGIYVDNGIIHGGPDDGQPLYLDNR